MTPEPDKSKGDLFEMSTKYQASVEPRGLSEKEAAAYLGISLATLRKHGPNPLKLGKPVHDKKILDSWYDKIFGISSNDQGWTEAGDGDHQVEVH